MRFRKVRSFLSAYSNGELTGRRLKAIRKLLADDPSVQKEEQAFRAMNDATKDMPNMTVSDDFNSKLLNRIAEERFAETRTNAYLPPTRVPRPRWLQAAPVVVSAVIVAFVAIGMMGPQTVIEAVLPGSSHPGLDNSYLTVQPTDNPNLAVKLSADWSLDKEIERSRRAMEIFSSLSNGNGFGVQNVSAHASPASPYVRPVIKIYRVTNAGTEGSVY